MISNAGDPPGGAAIGSPAFEIRTPFGRFRMIRLP